MTLSHNVAVCLKTNKMLSRKIF